ncbi:recombinase family protein [Mycolicibacterium tokaiense]|uniref:Site-specific recombinase n=1 Tax=Mycolicibacterium tokaiense TaxID=39695 RepID=A0A378TIK5_9MYCO|nr:site-specific recombinase [Mycolicibacterium tokaiense]
MSFGAIAKQLETEGILSPTGRSTWQPSTARRIYQSATAAAVPEEVSAR